MYLVQSLSEAVPVYLGFFGISIFLLFLRMTTSCIVCDIRESWVRQISVLSQAGFCLVIYLECQDPKPKRFLAPPLVTHSFSFALS